MGYLTESNERLAVRSHLLLARGHGHTVILTFADAAEGIEVEFDTGPRDGEVIVARIGGQEAFLRLNEFPTIADLATLDRLTHPGTLPLVEFLTVAMVGHPPG